MTSLDSDADRNAVRLIANEFGNAWNAHDMQSFGRLFTEDAEFVNVAGMWWRGRDQIQGAHAHTHANFFKTSTLNSDVASLKFLGGDAALVHLTWNLIGHLEPDGQVGAPRNGILVLTMAKSPAGWRIAAAQNTNELAEARARMAPRSQA